MQEDQLCIFSHLHYMPSSLAHHMELDHGHSIQRTHRPGNQASHYWTYRKAPWLVYAVKMVLKKLMGQERLFVLEEDVGLLAFRKWTTSLSQQAQPASQANPMIPPDLAGPNCLSESASTTGPAGPTSLSTIRIPM